MLNSKLSRINIVKENYSMHKEGIESWRIVVSSDISLNFILFTGCLYGLIDVDNIKGRNRLWPSKHFNDKLTKQLPLLKKSME